MMNVRDEAYKQLSSGMASKTDDIIRGGLPEDFRIEDVARQIYPDGVEVFLYQGEPFLELHPPVFGSEEPEKRSDNYKVTVTQNYRYLKPSINPDSLPDNIEATGETASEKP